MKKSNLVKNIKITHASMKDIIIEAGIQEPQFNFAIKNIEKQTEEYQNILLNWLIDFRNKEYFEIKKLLEQFSGWKYYKLHGINNFPELVILRRRQKTLREAWHSRPRPKKEIKKEGCEAAKKNEQLQHLQTPDSQQESP